MSRLGFIPDFYYGQPLQALHTPGPSPGPLGRARRPGDWIAPLGCTSCAGPRAESLGLVMVDDNPLGAFQRGSKVRILRGAGLGMSLGKGLTIAGIVGGLAAGAFAGVKLARRRRRR